MSGNPSWRLGQICGVEDEVNLDKAVLLAEVYSRALSPEDGGLVATYFLAHDLDADVAERAVEFFHDQVGLIVDPQALVTDVGAELPALVTIRYSVETRDYLATALEWDLLRLLPSETVVSREGWDLFCAFDAIAMGRDAPEAGALPTYDDREVRRQVLLNRASIEEDRTPWLKQERDIVRGVIADKPEGYEVFEQQAEDIEAVLKGDVVASDRYSVVVVTKVERRVMNGAVSSWVQQIGREVVVAHGLDAVQAAHALTLVKADPMSYLDKDRLLSGPNEREMVCGAVVVPDSGLNWISTDLTGRRNAQAFVQLAARFQGAEPAILAMASSIER